MVPFFLAIRVGTKFLVISKGEGRSPLISFIQCLRSGATHKQRREAREKAKDYMRGKLS